MGNDAARPPEPSETAREAPAPVEPARPERVELRAFRVRLFRSIVDSGEVPVFPLTALVGRNRSGKTSLLEALFRLHPRAPRGYDPERDWPRNRRRRDVLDVAPCTAELALPPESARSLVAAAGLSSAGSALPRRLELARTYGGRLEARLDGRAPEQAAAREALVQAGSALVPPFVLLGREGLLEGSVDLVELRRRSAEGAAGPADQSLLALLAVAGLELEGLRTPLSRGAERRRLAEGSRQLSRRLSARRGRRLTLALEGSSERLVLFLAVAGAGLRPLDSLADEVRWRLTLDTLLERDAPRAQVGSRPVLLLDEPARIFRAAGEAALADELGRLAEEHTVLHSAPLPFRAALAHDEQVLVLGWNEDGPRVRGGPLPGLGGGWELRAALGMSGRRGFLVAETSLVVEGSQDARLLETLSDLARRSGEAGLPADLEIVAAGGAWEVAHVAAFLAARGLGVVALFDGDEAGRTGRAALLERWRAQPAAGRLLALDVGRALGLRRESSIEDLFPPEWYLARARRSLRQGPEALPAGGKLSARVEAAFEASGSRFEKGLVNEAVRAELEASSSLQDLPPDLARRARRLLATLRRALERVR